MVIDDNMNLITKEGYDNMQEKLSSLRGDRRIVSEQIADARSKGDLSENAEYHAARERQSMLEKQIAELEGELSKSKVADISRLSNQIVSFGSTVLLRDLEEGLEEKKYRIVGTLEADLTRGFLSVRSPLAQELIGCKKGDIVSVSLPRGLKSYEILSIEV